MKKMMDIQFDAFFTYDRMFQVCQDLAENYSEIVKMHIIGETHQGRKIPLLEISDFADEEYTERPGYYVDAITHAEELVGCSVALFTASHLVDGVLKDDQQIKQLLRRVVFYIVPMVNPDGVEAVLTQRHPWTGNGRYLPGEEQPEKGFYYFDVDGNNIVAQMRVPDPNGEWKASEEDDRLLVLREPDEEGGQYYRLLPEGMFRDWDGTTLLFEHRTLDGNLNRNYPSNWLPDRLQYGAGKYPTSEPEIKATTDWLMAHKNIAGVASFHTQGGVILRPFSSQPDTEFLPQDLQIYKDIGEMGTEETGYPLISVYHDFTPHPVSPRGGTLVDLCYEEMGIPSFTVELWNAYQKAGVEDVPFYTFVPLPEAAMLKLLHWVTANVQDGFVPWTPFEHPQLGTVEVGGWNRVFAISNPPGDLIEKIASDNARFIIRHASVLPRIQLEDVTIKTIEKGVYLMTAVVANAGYLPTNLTQMALKNEIAEPVKASLQGDEGEIIHGPWEREIGHLAGRSERKLAWTPWGGQWGVSRTSVSWVVSASPGKEFLVRVGCPRAGFVEKTIKIEG